MAQKRMFDRSITESDAFVSMPLSSQALYFHLGMEADDEGVVNNPLLLKRAIGAADDDLNILIGKNFIIPFDSGVIVIKHWKVNNTIKTDRFKPSKYREELAQLSLKENGSYTLGTTLEPQWNQHGTNMEPQTRLDKIRLDKTRLDQTRLDKSIIDRLTPNEWKRLDNKYEDALELIDLVDSSIEADKVDKPFAYVVAVAEKQKWPTKE